MPQQQSSRGQPNKVTIRSKSRRPHHARYRSQFRRYRNKLRAMKKHAKRNPNDLACAAAIEREVKRGVHQRPDYHGPSTGIVIKGKP